MAVIPPFFFDCVVAIGVKDARGATQWTASGFLYGRHIAGSDGKYRIYLVTNKHVVEGKSRIELRFNPMGGAPAREFHAELSGAQRRWFAPRTPDIDLVVVPLLANKLQAEGIQFAWFHEDKHVMFRSAALQAGVSEGDGIFVLGFPMGLVGGQRSYVISRGGTIARVRDALAGESNEILADVVVFPGNSGGPAVTRPEATAITGTKSPDAANLLGVVASYVPYRDVALSSQTNRPRVIFEENSGLTMVIPTDFIREAVDEHQAWVAKQEAGARTVPVKVPPAGKKSPAKAPAARKLVSRNSKADRAS